MAKKGGDRKNTERWGGGGGGNVKKKDYRTPSTGTTPHRCPNDTDLPINDRHAFCFKCMYLFMYKVFSFCVWRIASAEFYLVNIYHQHRNSYGLRRR